jgi:hypothetical protein
LIVSATDRLWILGALISTVNSFVGGQ